MDAEPAPATLGDSNRSLKIAGAALLGCVALCGLLGTCLFVLTLLAPFFPTTP